MFLWHELQKEPRPILIYGMGNGAEKILGLSREYQVPIADIFASNDHARKVSFCGYDVLSFSEALEKYDSAVILVAFGVYQEEVLKRIEELNKTYSVLVPDLPLIGGEILTPDCLVNRRTQLSAARALLSDEKSRNVYDAMLEAKLTGALHPHFREDTPRTEDMQLLRLNGQEDYLDLGAYNGDTIEEFLSLAGGNYSTITAFEPDMHNMKKLRENTASLSHISLIPCASWNEEATLTFSGKGGRNCAMRPDLPGQYKHLHEVMAIPVDSLDRDFSFIKMDVEGAEKETLIGMKALINRCHPKLLISAYHKPDDFITLPLLLEKLCPGYRMYLRRNRCLPAWEIQLYCVFAGI